MEDLPANSEVVVVGSSRASADDFVRILANERVDTTGIHRFSLMQFAVEIGRKELARRGVAPLTSMSAVALAIRSTFEVGKSRTLKVLWSRC